MPPKSLQPAAVWGRRTPVVNKRPETDARNRPPENPRKLPALRAVVVAHNAGSGARALSRFFFRPRNLGQKGRFSLSNPLWGLGLHPVPEGRTQRHTGANTGRFGWRVITTLGSCCGLLNAPGAGVGMVYFPVYALCPSPAGMNATPSFSAFAFAFCCIVARSAFANCRS